MTCTSSRLFWKGRQTVADGNGGGLTTGQRLERIENQIERIHEQLDERITKHRERNQEAVEILGKSILNKVSEFEPRIKTLETFMATDIALEKYKRWIFGGVLFLVLNFIVSVAAVVLK